MVRVHPIVEGMLHTISTDRNWQMHFSKIVDVSNLPDGAPPSTLVDVIVSACEYLAKRAGDFRRQTLQTRFFETGDNFYLGMEMLREYDKWKKSVTSQIMSRLGGDADELIDVKKELADSIDRLWYENCLETIRTGDVYNPGARHRVPRFQLINSLIQTELRGLPLGESFRLASDKKEKYEILEKSGSKILVRTVEGYVSWMEPSTLVYREGNLTRSPDGNQESKVALATFPVGHYVNHRTMRLTNAENGYVFTFAGDDQSTPHFMRYSGKIFSSQSLS